MTEDGLQTDELLAQVTEVAGYKVLPPCVVYAKIGQGGMGAVYRGRHLNLDIDVAVKCLKPSLVKDDPQFVARFRREGQSAARINHQNVIRVFDVAEDQGLHYLIMELVQGETARQRVDRKGPLAVGEALQILYESALGLGEAHRLGIVHRDIKPDNLLIASNGQVKVADLGLAKPAVSSGSGSKMSMLSSANQIMGTPSYMPPEQWDGAAVTSAADVWALGATLWFLLVGHEAIRDDSPARIMSRIVLQPFPDVRMARADVPPDVVAVIVKATAKEPGERYLDALEMAEAIEALPTRRGSLRDRAAGTTELRTLLSPPPIKNLEQIKQWLREDVATRKQTPRSTGGASGAQVVGNDGATMVTPAKGGTVVQPQPGGGRARGLVIGALLLLAGAGGTYAWLTREPPKRDEDPTKREPLPDPDKGTPELPPPPPPFARADELEGRGDLAGAIEATERVDAAQPERTARLARLRSRRAVQLAEAGSFAPALAELTRAQQLADSAELRQQRTALRAAMTTAAATALSREQPTPTTPVAKDQPVTFRGRLSADYVQALLLGGEEAARTGDGSFAVQRAVPTDGALPVAVRIDDEVRSLEPWRVTIAAPLPGLAFLGEIRLATPPETPREDGRLVTREARIVLAGKLSETNAKLFVDDKEAANVAWRPDGSFTLTVDLPTDGERDLRIVARKDDREREIVAPRVLRLSRATQLQPIDPKSRNNNRVARTVVPLRVRATDRFASTVVAKRGDQEFPLQRDAIDPEVFAGEITLVPGGNKVDLLIKNLAGFDGTDTFTFDCTARKPALSLVRLVDGPKEREVRSGENLVANADAKLLLRCDDANAELFVGGQKVEPTQPFGLALRPFLREGEAVKLELLTRNENGDSSPCTATVVLDSVPPEITATVPEPVPAGSTFEVAGRWSDRSDVPKLLVNGTTASVTRDGPGGGTWKTSLRAPAENTTWRVVAEDAAGNPGTAEVLVRVVAPTVVVPVPPIEPDRTQRNEGAIVAKDLPGFRPKGEQLTASGYPLRIEHKGSGIELVAIAVDAATGKPEFYAAVSEVTVRQYDGTGSGAPKTGIRGDDIVAWLQGRGQGLALPTEAQWDRLVAAKNPDVIHLKESEGVYERLAPTGNFSDSNWPLRKDPSTTTIGRGKTGAYFGFRVVHRPQ